MSGSGLSVARLGRMRGVLARHVDSGEVPGLVALVARRGEVHVEAIGATGAGGGGGPMRRDTIFRIASITKQIAAAAAMTLVEECRLRLDDPVDELLPELAGRQVLRRPDGPLGGTVPAHRPVTLRDLLTFQMGVGAMMLPPGTYPIQRALDEAGLLPRPEAYTPAEPDEWMKRLGSLPLIYQPGEKWIYHTGSDVLGVLMARAMGQPLEEVMAERLFGPLAMADTGFHVPAGKLSRLPAAYRPGHGNEGLVLVDDPAHSQFAQPPIFPSAAGGRGPSGDGGLVSTADDLLAYCTMMLNRGRHGGERILSRPSVEVMITDHLTGQQKAENAVILGDGTGWGFGVSVTTRRTGLAAPGRFGWTGGVGISVYTDPAEELIGILLTQCQMTSPAPPPVFRDFWTCAYQSIDD